jgi:hypothetical protein
MEKQIYYGNLDFFNREDFVKLMEDIGAKKLAEEKEEETEHWSRMPSQNKVVYYSPGENVTLIHTQKGSLNYNSEIVALGTPKKISLIEQKLLEKVKEIKSSRFSPEGLRTD